ncbi:MAG: SRPBCC family protein [Ilumatobacteraceae bacterium]|jgi:uncharacterized protein YndB with AHSA1/START domain|nr:SRPBCC family protein [Ilumatobacteraceae bacterium]
MEITDVRDIPASVESVWACTLDVESWPRYTPTITSVRLLDAAPIAVGHRAEVRQPGQRPTVWTVTAVEPNRRFEWRASVFGVRTTATHLLEPIDAGCRNTLRLTLEGRGAALMARLLGRRLAAVLATENLGFEAAAAEWPTVR